MFEVQRIFACSDKACWLCFKCSHAWPQGSQLLAAVHQMLAHQSYSAAHSQHLLCVSRHLGRTLTAATTAASPPGRAQPSSAQRARGAATQTSRTPRTVRASRT